MLYIAGVVGRRAQWRFGIFTVGLQMAIELNQDKPLHHSGVGNNAASVKQTSMNQSGFNHHSDLVMYS